MRWQKHTHSLQTVRVVDTAGYGHAYEMTYIIHILQI